MSESVDGNPEENSELFDGDDSNDSFDLNVQIRFEIPERDDDLLLQSEDLYYVKTILSEDEAIQSLQEFNAKLSDSINPGRWIALFDFFPGFFSLARSCSIYGSETECSWTNRLKAVNRLLSCFRILYPNVVSCVQEILKHDGIPSNQILNKCNSVRNGVLMLIYLFNRFTYLLEGEFIKREKSQGKKGRAKVNDLDSEMSEWVRLRRKIVEACIQLCDISLFDKEGKKRKGAIKYLWRPPKIDFSVCKTLYDVVLKFLEHPDNIRASSKLWLTEIFQLCRLICLRYDCYHKVAAALIEKSCHLEYLKESTSHCFPFIEPILAASHNNDMDALISHMLNIVSQLEHQDYVQQSKPISLFLQTIAERAPNVLVKHLTGLAPYLENDPTQLRSAALSAFADMICSDTLQDENCFQYSRLLRARDRMCEKLMNHLCDTNGPVRSKVVHLWTKMAERQRIPLKVYQECILSRLGKRLLDKSVNVRKASVQFLSTFLCFNPFGHDFSSDIHLRELIKSLKKREALKKLNPEFDRVSEAERLFNEQSEKISFAIQHWLSAHKEKSENAIEVIDVDINELYGAAISQIIHNPDASVKILLQFIMAGYLPSIKVEEDFDVEDTSRRIFGELKEAFIRYRITEQLQDDAALLEYEEKNEDYSSKLAKLEKSIESFKDKLLIAMELEECVPLALRAVIHGDLAEMKEGIKFVVECKNFMIGGADKAVRILCSLIWRQNMDIRKEVLEAASRMFISSNRNIDIQQQSTACNLLSVVEGMKEEERGCVEEVICQMAVENLSSGVLEKIWDEFNQAQGKKKLIPIRLLAILTRACKDDLRKRLRSYQKIIRDPEMDSDVRAEALLAISNLSSERGEDETDAFRIPASDSLFATVETFLLYELLRTSTSTQWFNIMRSCLSIYFNLAKDTTVVVGRAISRVIWYNKRISEWVLYYEQAINEEQDQVQKKQYEDLRNYYKKMFAIITERSLSICGEIALRCVIYADITFCKEARRLPYLIAKYKTGEIKPSDAPSRPLKDFEYRSAIRKGLFDYSADKDDHGSSGTTDEERVRMRSDIILEKKLWKNGRILSRLLPFVVYSLRAESSPPTVKNAAALAFAKFMLVSRDLSERGSKLFFSCLNNSEWPSIRNNLMLAAGDLCFRAPNMVEKFAADVYSMTSDRNPCVRETAILVLTHLTNNQMLKLRGSLADVARCYLDDSPTIRNLTKEFFISLNKKGSYVYNLMPDFISRLSRSNRDVNLNEFKAIMTELLELVKDKHADALIEKLCQRFEMAKTGEAISRNKYLPYYFSFCISKLTLSDKSLYKMRDCLPCYAVFLRDKQIFNDFLACLQHVGKNTKSIDVKHDAEDFEKQLRTIHEKGQRLEDVERRVIEKKKTTPKRPMKSRGRIPNKKTKTVRFSDSESD